MMKKENLLWWLGGSGIAVQKEKEPASAWGRF